MLPEAFGRGSFVDESLTSPTPATVALALRRSRRREGEVFRRIPRLAAPVSLKHSPSDTAGETALHVIPFRCLHLGLSGWRSLSAKTRVNLA